MDLNYHKNCIGIRSIKKITVFSYFKQKMLIKTDKTQVDIYFAFS